MTPPVNPPREIEDPNDQKPEDWDERAKIPDPDAVKPDDWWVFLEDPFKKVGLYLILIIKGWKKVSLELIFCSIIPSLMSFFCINYIIGWEAIPLCTNCLMASLWRCIEPSFVLQSGKEWSFCRMRMLRFLFYILPWILSSALLCFLFVQDISGQAENFPEIFLYMLQFLL